MAEIKQKVEKAAKERPVTEKGLDPWSVISYPHLTEKSMNMVEIENKLVFIVERKFKKEQIQEAIEKQFKVKITDLKTVVTTKGKKKAIAKLSDDFVASDIASQLGMM